jgi:hypothetical protein
MASIDPLPLPFASWREGLFALSEALSDPARERIIVARLEATAAKKPVDLKEICALALLIPSRARSGGKPVKAGPVLCCNVPNKNGTRCSVTGQDS